VTVWGLVLVTVWGPRVQVLLHEATLRLMTGDSVGTCTSNVGDCGASTSDSVGTCTSNVGDSVGVSTSGIYYECCGRCTGIATRGDATSNDR